MTSGSVAGDETVPESPLSPEDTTTVTPSATAASLAAYSAAYRPGRWVNPKDSEITSACSVRTALSRPWIACTSSMLMNPLASVGVSTSDASIKVAPGASPSILKVQPAGSPENGNSLL